MHPVSLDRRRFLQQSATAAAGTLALPTILTRSARAEDQGSKNDRPIVGSIGMGGQGTHIAEAASHFGDIVAVCDVDRQRAEKGREKFGGKPEIYGDYRQLLDRKDIEIVTIGTPDHWHTAIALAALRAGKDVYCEKPLTLTIAEGQLLSKTVKETGRVFQVGTQQRSDWRFHLAAEMVRNGRLGKIQKVTVILPESTEAGGPFPAKPVPEYLNWEMWLGQAPLVDYVPERCHYTFRWWYEYSGGVMTDWGAHHMDICHWGLGMDDSGPLSIDGHATLPNIPGGYNTPKFFTIDMLYPNDVLVHVEIGDNGVLFEGDKGRLFVNRGKISGKPVEDLAAELGKKDVEELHDAELPGATIKLPRSNNHMGNFFDCVKSRNKPISDVWSHHRTISACHLANISMRLGRKLQWDAKAEKFVGDSEADGMLSRAQREPYTVS
ncbi:MAG: Gfo/Idh/MocA family oxidoreductase [Pirellulales bacterium]|nr:Gfo/Idh/MocA family oxidoreductase [Pirellulales bacterium]